MKYLSFSPSIAVLFLFFIFFNNNLAAQNNKRDGYLLFDVKTEGKLLSSNKLVIIVEVEVPDGWRLKVTKGYASMWEEENDIIDFSLEFLKSSNFQIVEHLKAARSPISPGYYYKDITFAQILRIDSEKLPVLIDAEVSLHFVSNNGQHAFERYFPYSWRVSKNKEERTVRVGWGDRERKKFYLDDLVKEKKEVVKG
jgi:hypothetical protein